MASEDAADDDDDDLEDKGIKKKRSNRVKKSSSLAAGKKGAPQSATKVPTLKIKLGKRKQASSVSGDECIRCLQIIYLLLDTI